MVSSRLSPFDVADVAMLMLITSADSREAASSKVVRVRVLFECCSCNYTVLYKEIDRD